MARQKKIMRSYAIDAELVERLEAYLALFDPPPSRTGVIETALKRYLSTEEPKAKKK